MTVSADFLRAALEYVACGWLVIPLHSPATTGCSCGRPGCDSPGKHPRTAHGLKVASCDPAQIREWWTRWPDANIGIVTGPESGILVLDVDGKQGEQSLIEFERRGSHLPDTYTVKTGGGGQHIYFLWSEGADVRNSQSRIAPGLDVRGQGGYVVAPPSLHASGAHYGINDSAIPPVHCPEWLPIPHPQVTRRTGTAKRGSLGRCSSRANRQGAADGSPRFACRVHAQAGYGSVRYRSCFAGRECSEVFPAVARGEGAKHRA